MGCCCRETQIYAIDGSVNVKTSHPLVLEVSQNPHLRSLLYTFFQISCFCSNGFGSCNAQSITLVPRCLPSVPAPFHSYFSEAVKPSALFNTVQNYFLASSSSHRCFPFLQLLEPLPTDGQNLGSIFNFLFRKRANNLYLPVSLLPCPSLNI